MKDIDNDNAAKANATRDNIYTIHINKCIEHDPSKPATTCMREK